MFPDASHSWRASIRSCPAPSPPMITACPLVASLSFKAFRKALGVNRTSGTKQKFTSLLANVAYAAMNPD